MIAVILPTSNELGLDYLPRQLASLGAHPAVELICVDNASTDGTAERIADSGARLINLPASNRAQRLNAGIRATSADIVLLHHPRSLLAPGAIDALLALPANVTWGGFTHRFDQDHPLLAWTSFYSNRVRMDHGGIVYLDHCIFCRREPLLAAMVPELDIFEDTALSRLLLRHGRPHRLDTPATTSATRYSRNGVWRQATMNQLMKLGYLAGLSPARMNRIYERGLHLNDDGHAGR
mgnify:FL=1